VTAVLTESPALPPGEAIFSSPLSMRRRITDRAATAGMYLAMGIVIIALVFISYFLISKGAQAINAHFLTSDIPRNSRRAGGGIGPAIVGTLIITGAAALMAIPLGVLGAIYLNEFGKQSLFARTVRFMSDVMTGVPSIVMGLFIYLIWVVRVKEQTGLAGAFALACLILPIVIRSTEEMLKLVPQDQRQASMAVGARTWRTTFSVVLPGAMAGIVSGSMLAIARAAGETAPLIFVAGVAFERNASLSGPNTALPALIFRNASEPFAAAQERAWGAALTLVVIVFVFTVLARVVARRFNVGNR
jgi:phosphate transport system permease protein